MNNKYKSKNLNISFVIVFLFIQCSAIQLFAQETVTKLDSTKKASSTEIISTQTQSTPSVTKLDTAKKVPSTEIIPTQTQSTPSIETASPQTQPTPSTQIQPTPSSRRIKKGNKSSSSQSLTQSTEETQKTTSSPVTPISTSLTEYVNSIKGTLQPKFIPIKSEFTISEIASVASQILNPHRIKAFDKIDSSQKASLGSDRFSKFDSVLYKNIQKSDNDITDFRIDPVYFYRQFGTLAKDEEVVMNPVLNDLYGCRYYIPVRWEKYNYTQKNTIGYFIDGNILVIISVGYSVIEDLITWVKLQEALVFGKNFIPETNQVADNFLCDQMNVNEAYFGRYNLKGTQYTIGFYRYKNYQFQITIQHPFNAFSELDVRLINFMLSHFLGGIPKIELPNYFESKFSRKAESNTKSGKATTGVSTENSPTPVEESIAVETTKGKIGSKTKKQNTSSSKKTMTTSPSPAESSSATPPSSKKKKRK